MKLCIVTSFYSPQRVAGRYRIEALVRAACRKHETIVLAPMDSTKVADEVLLTAGTQPEGENKTRWFRRALQESGMALRMLRQVRQARADRVFVSLPNAMLVIVALLLPRHSVLVLEVRDLFWCYLDKRGGIGAIAGWLLGRLVRLACHRAEAIIVTNPSEQEVVQRFAVKHEPVVIANGVSAEAVERIRQAAHGAENSVSAERLAYVGNVGTAQMIDRIAEMLQPAAPLEFSVAGKGARLGQLSRLTEAPEAEALSANLHLVYHGVLDESAVAKLYASARAILLPLAPGYESAVPSKAYELLATDKPIVCLGGEAVRRITEEFPGVYYADWTVDSLNRAVERALADTNVYCERHHRVLRQYGRDHLAELVLDRIENCG